MKQIIILNAEVPFTAEEQQQWQTLGEVRHTPFGKVYQPEELVKEIGTAEYAAFCPSVLGGFEGLKEKLTMVLSQVQNLKGMALNTTAFGYIPWDVVTQKNIMITSIPEYSRESVAEHTLAMMIGAAKRIYQTDRATQDNQYQLQLGIELAGKTLAVIGLGSIGSRVAELGRAIGMRVIGWNRSTKYLPGVEQLPDIEAVLQQADVISLNLAENQETHHFLSAQKMEVMKPGVIIVNTADRSLVDEAAMANALKTGKVDTYILEAEDHTVGPLAECHNAIFLKPHGWFTQESLTRNKQIWFDNLQGMINGMPKNVVSK